MYTSVICLYRPIERFSILVQFIAKTPLWRELCIFQLIVSGGLLNLGGRCASQLEENITGIIVYTQFDSATFSEEIRAK